MDTQKRNPAAKFAPEAVAVKIVVVHHKHGYTAYPLDGQIIGAVVGRDRILRKKYLDVYAT